MKPIKITSLIIGLFFVAAKPAMGATVADSKNSFTLAETIKSAHRNLKMIMFHWPSASTMEALQEAEKHGVNVLVLLDQDSMRKSSLQSLRAQLKDVGINTRISPLSIGSHFASSLVIDSQWAFQSKAGQPFGNLIDNVEDIFEFESDFDAHFNRSL